MVKIALSFDDGRIDNMRMIKEILEPLQIPATFNITVGYIEKSISEQMSPCVLPPLLKQDIIAISKNKLFEIAGHGYEHQNESNNLIKGVQKLRDWIHDDQIDVVGLASPFSRLNVTVVEREKSIWEKEDIRYIRVGDRIRSMRLIKKVLRKINRYVLHIPFLYYWVNKDCIIDSKDSYIFYSLPILKNDTLKEIEFFINKLIEKDKSCILMFHSILKPKEVNYNDPWSWDYSNFFELCMFLKEHEQNLRIQICRTYDLVRREQIKL